MKDLKNAGRRGCTLGNVWGNMKKGMVELVAVLGKASVSDPVWVNGTGYAHLYRHAGCAAPICPMSAMCLVIVLGGHVCTDKVSEGGRRKMRLNGPTMA